MCSNQYSHYCSGILLQRCDYNSRHHACRQGGPSPLPAAAAAAAAAVVASVNTVSGHASSTLGIEPTAPGGEGLISE
jgi:hypothetical protein